MSAIIDGMTVLERGWLSANGILFHAEGTPTALVDSGYCTHAPQTVALVDAALGGRPLERLLNTHLHSDHCGGNAALQQRYPALSTAIPPGEAEAVRAWDENALSYAATGQECPRFVFDTLLRPGSETALGGRAWQVHAAPGHDTHSVVLFEPRSRTLLSADALWANGFGVVFPELDGADAFGEVAATLDLIESLDPATVVPGHGPVFTDVAGALAAARSRLDGFVEEPARHALHAAKVLLKFKLLEWQRQHIATLLDWVAATPCMRGLHARHGGGLPLGAWAGALVADLERLGAARREGLTIADAG
jgi:glyoxylase-like metal-dependent hydrolase (beta-lactamase superfamily II)